MFSMVTEYKVKNTRTDTELVNSGLRKRAPYSLQIPPLQMKQPPQVCTANGSVISNPRSFLPSLSYNPSAKGGLTVLPLYGNSLKKPQ